MPALEAKFKIRLTEKFSEAAYLFVRKLKLMFKHQDEHNSLSLRQLPLKCTLLTGIATCTSFVFVIIR